MSAPVYFTSLVMILGTVLIVFAMRYRAAVRQSRVAAADDAVARALAEIKADLADTRDRLGAIEKLLKDVG